MSAIRLPLLYAFAGGCLSTAVLFGMWRTAEGGGASTLKQKHRSPKAVELVTVATAAKGVGPSSELAANAVGHAVKEPAASQVAPELDSAGTAPPAGSAVADVLMQLEAAYRERVSAQAPAQASAAPERAVAAASAASATPALEPARSVSAQPVAAVVPAVPVVTAAIAPPPAAPVAVAAPAVAAPAVAAAPVAVAPEVVAAPALVAQGAPPRAHVHYGDINQNTYITNIRQGDMYLIQMQQLAMLQYLQALGVSSTLASPARYMGGGAPQRGTLSTGITNPDNPWGFHFAPPNLVR